MHGCVVGIEGKVLVTENGGISWSQQTVADGAELRCVHFSDMNHGWIVGTMGAYLRTTDGGISWTEPVTGFANALNSVFFSDLQNGWIAGQFGSLYKSQDGGLTWTMVSSRTSQHLKAVCFVSPETGLIMGGNGTLLKTSTGGVVSVFDYPANTNEDHLKVEQNFPNPFSDFTGIFYELSSAARVNCKIYNSLGVLVAEPFTEFRNDGKHRLDFDGSNFPQGLYFCTFTLYSSGKFCSRTIKMSILR